MEPLYKNLTSGTEVVESQLGESFAEYLNAEIALRNIVDMEGARHWLSSTFLFVRVRCTCLEGWHVVLANEYHGFRKCRPSHVDKRFVSGCRPEKTQPDMVCPIVL